MAYIIKPLLTEKMNNLSERFPSRFGFVVRPEATKQQIKNEIESLYSVEVVDVNTARYAGKRQSRYTRSGLIKGQKPSYKKAYVTLKDGQTIDFYSNI